MTELDNLLAKVRAPDMPDGLSARILADAAMVQAEFQVPVNRSTPGIWAQLRSVLGGWPTLGGLVTAGVAGVWIGFAPPSFIPDPMQLVMGQNYELDLFDANALEDIATGDG